MRMIARAVSVAVSLILAGTSAIAHWGSATAGPVRSAAPSAETDPVPHAGDAADDPAIWRDGRRPGRSTIIGTDKRGGLAVYDLRGAQIHYYAGGTPNNVDLRQGVPLGRGRITLVVTTDTSGGLIRFYRVDPASRGLVAASARTIETGIGAAGLCLYRSHLDGALYAFVSDSSGTTQQWRILPGGGARFDARKVRTLRLDSVVEGCVADDRSGALYLAQEDVALWRYGAEPGDGAVRRRIDSVGPSGHLSADIEGLGIYRGARGTGYVIASSQGANEFAVYELGRRGRFVSTFAVVAGNGLDAVSHTDGLAATSDGLGPAFPAGLLVVQDDANDGGNQNFKLVDPRAVVPSAQGHAKPEFSQVNGVPTGRTASIRRVRM